MNPSFCDGGESFRYRLLIQTINPDLQDETIQYGFSTNLQQHHVALKERNSRHSLLKFLANPLMVVIKADLMGSQRARYLHFANVQYRSEPTSTFRNVNDEVETLYIVTEQSVRVSLSVHSTVTRNTKKIITIVHSVSVIYIVSRPISPTTSTQKPTTTKVCELMFSAGDRLNFVDMVLNIVTIPILQSKVTRNCSRIAQNVGDELHSRFSAFDMVQIQSTDKGFEHSSGQQLKMGAKYASEDKSRDVGKNIHDVRSSSQL